MSRSPIRSVSSNSHESETEDDKEAPQRSSTQASQRSSTKRQSSAPQRSDAKKHHKEDPPKAERLSRFNPWPLHIPETQPNKAMHHKEAEKNRKKAEKALTAKFMSLRRSSNTWYEQSTNCGTVLRWLPKSMRQPALRDRRSQVWCRFRVQKSMQAIGKIVMAEERTKKNTTREEELRQKLRQKLTQGSTLDFRSEMTKALTKAFQSECESPFDL